jgi:DNA-binding XRE family transcriptional regulator
MSSRIQFIERDGKREYAVVPMDIFNRLLESFDLAEDLFLLDEFLKSDDGFRIPKEIVERELAGESIIKLWREQRGMTQEELAGRASISKPYLSQLESGKRRGSIQTLASLAKALDVPLDVLTD